MSNNCAECMYFDSYNKKCTLPVYFNCLNYDHFQQSPLIQIPQNIFETKYVSHALFDEMKNRALRAEEIVKYQTLKINEQHEFSEWIKQVFLKEVSKMIASINNACSYKNEEKTEVGECPYSLPKSCYENIECVIKYARRIYEDTWYIYKNDVGKKNKKRED